MNTGSKQPSRRHAQLEIPISHHSIAATEETVRLGSLCADDPPVIEIQSGDRITLECVTGWPETTPANDDNFAVSPLVRAINASGRPRLAPHLLTGPVAIAGAEPGDALEVRIDAVELGADWGFCSTRPGSGTLQDEFNTHSVDYIRIDRKKRVGHLPYGVELPLAPFFGVMATAPSPAYQRVSSREPREYGGNLDNKELIAGTVLFLPVWVTGAKFYAGDGHAVQGDGETCVNGLETCLTGTFTMVLQKGVNLRYPRAETSTHFISMGMNADLDVAMQIAAREMIDFICARSRLSRAQAYRLCSLAVDFRITQNVNGEKGVHGLLRKGLLS